MLTRAVFEFDFDDSGISSEFVDIKGLAMDSLKMEIKDLLSNNELSEEDFKYEVVERELSL